MTSDRKPEDQSLRIPLLEEGIQVAKQGVDGDSVTVETLTDETVEWVRETVLNENVSIERVPVGREVDDPPRVREENGVTIIPVVREVLRIQKQLMLVEELHIRREQSAQKIEKPVTLRSMRANITRTSSDEGGNPGSAPEQD